MQALIAAARQRDVHSMIGGIDATNTEASHCTNASASKMSGRCRRSASSSDVGSICPSINFCWKRQPTPSMADVVASGLA
jgi:hypothetical protein